MNLNNAYRQKYEQEVNPQFTVRDWESFLNYRYRKRRRRHLLYYVIGGLAVVGLALLLYLSILQSTSSLQTQSEIYTGNLAVSSYDFAKTGQAGTQSGETDIPENEGKGMDHVKLTTPGVKGNKPTRKISQGQEKTGHKVPVRMDEDNASVHANSPESVITGMNNKKNSGHLRSVERKHENGPNQNAQPLESIPVAMGNGPFVSQNNIQHLLSPTFQSIRILPDCWQKNVFSGMIYGGTAFFLNNLTVDEQVHQFGFEGYYSVGHNLRIKTGVELSAVDYVATEMNPGIGVDFMESPGEHAIFQEAIVESMGLTVNLGMDYRVWQKGYWALFAGVSYGFAREIRKGIEYEFQDDTIDQMEIFVKSDRTERYIEPLMLKLDAGITYQTKAGGLNLLLSHPVPISRNSIALLNQWHLNIGVSHRF